MKSNTAGKPSAFGGKNSGQSFPRRDGKPASLENIVERVVAESAADDKKKEALQPEADNDAQAPVVMLVHTLLKEAMRRRASDIHIEPFEDSLQVRFRIDGALQKIQQLPLKLNSAMISRLKIMAELDICERRIPQDGCIRLKGAEGDDADFRLSTLPSVFGEKAVLRVLGKSNIGQQLDQVGMPEKELAMLREAIGRPDGLVLVTGPTGSGKTTTLYASLSEVNDPEISIFTAEDPVEGTLKGITQVQINQAVGLNFSTVLRSLLRQDPDVILVGEIRDKETIEIAIKAALTGHLVLSTLHTNDTAATIQRLLNMGVEPYLISSAVNVIVAQRLVRRVCEHCKEPQHVDHGVLERMGVPSDEAKRMTIYKGKGCKECGKTGYHGRIPIYEIMMLGEELKEAILKGASSPELKRLGRIKGMTTLREAGINRMRDGITTIDEVLGKTNDDASLDEPPLAEAGAEDSQEGGTSGTWGGVPIS